MSRLRLLRLAVKNDGLAMPIVLGHRFQLFRRSAVAGSATTGENRDGRFTGAIEHDDLAVRIGHLHGHLVSGKSRNVHHGGCADGCEDDFDGFHIVSFFPFCFREHSLFAVSDTPPPALSLKYKTCSQARHALERLMTFEVVVIEAAFVGVVSGVAGRNKGAFQESAGYGRDALWQWQRSVPICEICGLFQQAKDNAVH